MHFKCLFPCTYTKSNTMVLLQSWSNNCSSSNITKSLLLVIIALKYDVTSSATMALLCPNLPWLQAYKCESLKTLLRAKLLSAELKRSLIRKEGKKKHTKNLKQLLHSPPPGKSNELSWTTQPVPNLAKVLHNFKLLISRPFSVWVVVSFSSTFEFARLSWKDFHCHVFIPTEISMPVGIFTHEQMDEFVSSKGRVTTCWDHRQPATCTMLRELWEYVPRYVDQKNSLKNKSLRC